MTGMPSLGLSIALLGAAVMAPLRATPAPEAADLPEGAGKLELPDTRDGTGAPVRVWYYRPARFGPDGRILFVMHVRHPRRQPERGRVS